MMRFTLLAFVGVLSAAPEEVALPEDIGRQVENGGHPEQAASFDLIERWNAGRKKLEDHAGFSWTAGYYSAALGVLGGNGVPTGASGDLTVQGIWAPAHRWTDNPTELRFRLRHRHAYFGTPVSALSGEIGALWGVIDGYSNSGFEIPDFFLRHQFEAIGLELRYGQMTIDSQFGGHQLASSKSYYLNQAFASNPAVAFPRFGAGFTAVQRFDNGFSIGLGTTTVQGTQNGNQVDLEFGSDDLFHALQFAYEFEDRQELRHRLILLGWHSDSVEDAAQPEGQGVQLTYERAINDEGGQFFSTLSWSEGGAAPVDYLLTAGFGRPCRDDDFFGLAAGIGRGSGSSGSLQMVLEGFYRRQFGEHFQVTPDLQLLIGEDLTTGPGVRVIAGLRATGRF